MNESMMVPAGLMVLAGLVLLACLVSVLRLRLRVDEIAIKQQVKQGDPLFSPEAMTHLHTRLAELEAHNRRHAQMLNTMEKERWHAKPDSGVTHSELIQIYERLSRMESLQEAQADTLKSIERYLREQGK